VDMKIENTSCTVLIRGLW